MKNDKNLHCTHGETLDPRLLLKAIQNAPSDDCDQTVRMRLI